MDNQTDVISMDFPEYEEEYSPFPDVKTELPFAEGKDKVYDRNIRLAEKMELAEISKVKAVRQKAHKRKKLPSFKESEKRQLALAATVIIALVIIAAAFSDGSRTDSEEYYDFELPAAYEYVDSLENTEVEQHLEKLEKNSAFMGNFWLMTVRFTVKNNGSNSIGFTPARISADFGIDEIIDPETDFYKKTVFIVKNGEQAEFSLTYNLYSFGNLNEMLAGLKGFYYRDSYIDADSELLDEIKKALDSTD